jgi:hypothetical protein
VYVIDAPVPVGMYANFETSSAVPPKSAVMVTGVSHVLAMYAA